MNELLPVRMLNEYSYCPRLFAMEWLNKEWADSADTVAGRTVHRRVDQESEGSLPEHPDEVLTRRSVYLGDPFLGLVAKIDLVEAEGLHVTPLDYKKGSPRADGTPWEPERVQICAQGLLLWAHGYTVERGFLYYATIKRRVEVVLDDELVSLTLRLRDEALALGASPHLPPPLVDSPKCPRCSLVGICMPDEQNLLSGRSQTIRPMVPDRDDRTPLYVGTAGSSVGKEKDDIVIRAKEEIVGRVGLPGVSRLVVLGNVSVSTPLLRELAEREIPVSYHSAGGWFVGLYTPAWGHNVMTRMAQHRVAGDKVLALPLAQAFVRSKILNCRTLLRRNGDNVPEDTLLRMKALADDVGSATDIPMLMGMEGAAAALYFRSFSLMIRSEWRERFDFEGRNRRPPKDPINCLLSFAYAFLTREVTTTLHCIGLDPFVGFLHQPRYGRAALALDMMEEFRPILADSVVLNVINNGIIGLDGFTVRTTGVALGEAARRAFIQAWERRLDESMTHPVLGMKLSYRRIIEVQARLLGKTLLGDLKRYPELRIR